MEFQKATGFLKNAYYQGHGRYVNQIMRLTLKFCKNSVSSREVRKFIETRLVDTARVNPGCVLYVKPRIMKSPCLKAEYLNGEDHYLNLYQMSSAQVEAWINWYLTRSGYQIYKLNRNITTYNPSIQGHWNPFLFRDQKLNVTEFPNEELGRHIPREPSATDQILSKVQEKAQA